MQRKQGLGSARHHIPETSFCEEAVTDPNVGAGRVSRSCGRLATLVKQRVKSEYWRSQSGSSAAGCFMTLNISEVRTVQDQAVVELARLAANLLLLRAGLTNENTRQQRSSLGRV